MNMLTCVATINVSKGTKHYALTKVINQEIENKREEGYMLRGTPIAVGDEYVILTFEKPDNNEGDIIDDVSREIPEDR